MRLDSSDDALITTFGLLLEAQAALVRTLGRDLEADHGLPLSWYEVLLRIERTPGRRLRVRDLADALALTTGGMTRLLDRIEAGGLVQRQPDPGDRRSIHIVVTDAGRAALTRATVTHLRGLRSHLAEPLTARELAALDRTLRKLVPQAPPAPAVTPAAARSARPSSG